MMAYKKTVQGLIGIDISFIHILIRFKYNQKYIKNIHDNNCFTTLKDFIVDNPSQ